MIYITFLQYIWRKKKLYIFCKFWSFSYRFCICSLRRMGKFRLVYRWSFFFCFFFWGGCAVSANFGQFTQGSGETVHLIGIFSLGNWVKRNLYFEPWLSLFICLFIIIITIVIIIIIIIFWLPLIRHIRFCWCELL